MSPPPPTNGVPDRPVALVASCMGWGSGLTGAERGPALLLEAGLVECLEEAGVVVDSVISVQADPQMSEGDLDQQSREQTVLASAMQVADAVCAALTTGRFPVVIGGDHTSAIGLYLGLGLATGEAIGSVWIDAHPDVNTPETSPSGNMHGMMVAGLLGFGSPAMCDATASSTLDATAISMVGVRSIDPGEAAFLDAHGIPCAGMDAVRGRGLGPCLSEAAKRASSAMGGWGLTIDLDAIDPTHAPFVGTQVPDGLDPDMLCASLRDLPERERLLGLEVTEYTSANGDGRVACELVSSLVSEVGRCIT